MESIQQPNVAASAASFEPICCNSTIAKHARAMSSMSKVLGLLIVGTILSYMSRHDCLSMTSWTCATPPCPDGPAGVVSLVALLGGGKSAAAVSSSPSTHGHGNLSNIPLRPIVVELGVVALLQMIGFPVLGRAGFLMRRVNFMRLGRHLHVPTPVLRQLSRQARFLTRASGKVWKTAESIYSRTSLSKLVQRIKKLLKIVSHSHDDEDSDEANHHSH